MVQGRRKVKKLRGQKKASWIHPLETLSPSISVEIDISSTTVIIVIEVYGAGTTEGQNKWKYILLLIMSKMAPLFPPTLWSWLILMWPKAQEPGPPELIWGREDGSSPHFGRLVNPIPIMESRLCPQHKLVPYVPTKMFDIPAALRLLE